MSDLPESLEKLRAEALAQAFLDQPYRVDDTATAEREALRAQQYLAAQSFHIRKALEAIAAHLAAPKR